MPDSCFTPCLLTGFGVMLLFIVAHIFLYLHLLELSKERRGTSKESPTIAKESPTVPKEIRTPPKKISGIFKKRRVISKKRRKRS
jgi:hypothetical protein